MEATVFSNNRTLIEIFSKRMYRKLSGKIEMRIILEIESIFLCAGCSWDKNQMIVNFM